MKNTEPVYIAVDLGSSNGRIIAGRLDGGAVRLQVLHRFEHTARYNDGYLRWNWGRIRRELQAGLETAVRALEGRRIISISCDSWAQDFGLIDEQGKFIWEPVSYRDDRTSGMPEALADIIPLRDLLRRTGSVALPITALCQLRSMVLKEPAVLDRAHCLLYMADLLNYELCGVAATDWTMATVSQMLNLEKVEWDGELLEKLSIPSRILPQIKHSPSVLGQISARAGNYPLPEEVSVVTTAGHDTSAAASLLPEAGQDTLALVAGSWSMLGCRISDKEDPGHLAENGIFPLGLPGGEWGGFIGITGLWLLQACLHKRMKRSDACPITDIMDITNVPAVSIIDPDDAVFRSPEDMAAAICSYCRKTDQRIPGTFEEIAAVIFISLALSYGFAADRLEKLTGKRFKSLRLMGGGSRIRLLCQLAADVLEMPVIAGPAEATAMGNIILQAGIAGDSRVNNLVQNIPGYARYLPAKGIEPELKRRFAELKRHGGQVDLRGRV